MCNPNQFTWFTRIYLEGQTAPSVEEKAGWDIDGIEIKVRHDFAAASRRWEGMVAMRARRLSAYAMTPNRYA